jgi:hypothetical protein
MSQNCSAKKTKGLGPTASAYSIIHVQHQLCGYQMSMCRNEEKLKMYFMKYGKEILKSMYSDGIPYLATLGIVGSRAGERGQKKASIVWCSTNSTHSSTIYKLTSRIAGWMTFYRPSTISGSRVLGLAG